MMQRYFIPIALTLRFTNSRRIIKKKFALYYIFSKITTSPKITKKQLMTD